MGYRTSLRLYCDRLSHWQTGQPYGAGRLGARRHRGKNRQSSFILDNGGEGESGYLNLHARNTNTQNASAIINRNKDSITVVSGDKGVSFGTVSTEETHNHYRDGKHFNNEYTRRDVGTTVQGDGAISIVSNAGKVDIINGQINSDNDHTGIYGAKGVDIANGWQDDELQYATTGKSRKWFSTTRTADQHQERAHQALASNVTGKTVSIEAGAGADLILTGSNVVSDHNTVLKAGRDIYLNSAENTYYSDHQHQSTTSGLTMAGIGIHYGTTKEGLDSQQSGTVHSPGMVGALDGNVIIDAGNHYQNNGSLVYAGRGGEQLTREQWDALSDADKARAGNVLIKAKSAIETGLVNTDHSESQYRMEKSGLTLSLGGKIVSAAQGVVSGIDHAGSGNSRVAAMAAANTAWNAYDGYQAIQSGSGGDGISLSLTYGESKSRSEQERNTQRVQAAQTTSAGTVNYQIKGKGEASTLDIIGSDSGGRFGTNFDVEGKKTFKSLELAHDGRSENRSSGWGAGVSITLDKNPVAGGTANGHYGKGYSKETATTHRLSHIGSSEGVLDLGDGKTTLNGAQGFGRRIIGNTEDLTIISPQQSGQSEAKQFNADASVTVGYGGATGSANVSYQEVDGSMQSINAESGQRDALKAANAGDGKAAELGGHISEDDRRANAMQARQSGQSGLFAGDDGFQLTNTGTTTLIGGIITSSAKAEADGKNRFTTDRLLIQDLDNHSKLDAKGFGIGGGWSEGSGLSKAIGIGMDGHDARGTTHSSINTTNITIRDEAGQYAQSGKTVAETIAQANRGITLETAKANSGATGQSINTDAAMASVGEQVEVSKEFAPHAAQTVAYVGDKLGHSQAYNEAELQVAAAEAVLASPNLSATERAAAEYKLGQAKATLNQYQSAQDTWGEGGIGRAVMHGLVGGIITGDIGGVAGGAGASLASPVITDLKSNSGAVGGVLIDTALTGGLAYGLGGASSAATAANTDWNNRQLHPSEMDWIQENAPNFARKEGISEEEAVIRLTVQAAKMVDKYWATVLSDTEDGSAKNYLSTYGRSTDAFIPGPAGSPTSQNIDLSTKFKNDQGDLQNFFTVRGDDYNRPGRYADLAYAYNAKHGGFIDKNLVNQKHYTVAQKVDMTVDTIANNKATIAKEMVVGATKIPWEMAHTIIGLTGPNKESILKDIKDATIGKLFTGSANAKDALTPTTVAHLNSLYGETVSPYIGTEGILGAGTVALEAIPAGKIAGKAAKNATEALETTSLGRILTNDPAKLPVTNMASRGNVSASKVSSEGKLIDPPQEVLDMQKQLLNNANHHATGTIREVIADSYFKGSGFSKLESKCGANCFDGVYLKNGEIYIVEVKPIGTRGNIKLSSNSKSPRLGTQMSDQWINNRANHLANFGTSTEARETGEMIKRAIDGKQPINKIVVGVNDQNTVILNLGNKVEVKP